VLDTQARVKVSVREIIDWVRREFDLSLTSVSPVTGGADAAATVWRAVARDGGEYAVKLSGRDTDAGLLVAQELAAAAIPGIAAPLTNVAGRPSSSHDGTRLSVFPWIAGPRGADTEMTTDHWRQFGALLGSVHRAKLQAELPAEESRDPAVAAARTRLTEFRESSPAFDNVSREMVTAWLDAGESITALVDRCEKLAAELHGRPASNAVCHGDAHAINLIIGPDDQPFLLDWDEVSSAPPERDLMFVIGGGIFTDDPVTDEHQRAFVAGYGSPDLDATRLAYYYCTRAVEDITLFAGEILDRTRKPDDRAFALRCILDQLSPTGTIKVAIAFTG
jgi:spectinomycin phosphotransferase